MRLRKGSHTGMCLYLQSGCIPGIVSLQVDVLGVEGDMPGRKHLFLTFLSCEAFVEASFFSNKNIKNNY